MLRTARTLVAEHRRGHGAMYIASVSSNNASERAVSDAQKTCRNRDSSPHAEA